MNIIERQALEKQIVRHLIRVAKAAGWECTSVHDGEETHKCPTEEKALHHVFSVDESWIYFRKQYDTGYVKQTVFIVLGNDGWDCLADWSMNGAFMSEVMEPMDDYTDKMCEQHCS